MNKRVLIVDDDETFGGVLARALCRRGYDALAVQSVTEALDSTAEKVPDSVVLDLNLDGVSGLTLIPALRVLNPACQIVMLTGYASIATAVDAIKLGAVQYLAKPVEVSALLAAFGDAPTPVATTIPSELPLSVERLEWEHIQRVLKEYGGNVSATARALNMHRRTLQRKLSKRPVRR